MQETEKLKPGAPMEEVLQAYLSDIVRIALERGMSPAAVGAELMARGLSVMVAGIDVPFAREIVAKIASKSVDEMMALLKLPPAGTA